MRAAEVRVAAAASFCGGARLHLCALSSCRCCLITNDEPHPPPNIQGMPATRSAAPQIAGESGRRDDPKAKPESALTSPTGPAPRHKSGARGQQWLRRVPAARSFLPAGVFSGDLRFSNRHNRLLARRAGRQEASIDAPRCRLDVRARWPTRIGRLGVRGEVRIPHKPLEPNPQKYLRAKRRRLRRSSAI